MNQETIIQSINRINPEVLSKAGWSDRQGYLNRVYRFLDKMIPGKVYNVAELANAETLQLFILVVQLYQHEVKGNTISFLRDDYRQLRKNAQ